MSDTTEGVVMKRATLVIMAAGLGSRFKGGIKQLEPIGPNGEIMMEYSVYDAIEAGFDQVVFVIRKALEKDFRAIIGDKLAKKIKVVYAYQELEDIPQEFQHLLEGRTKPWGTGQAILACKDVIDSPFLVINADDYYGKQSYREMYQYLTRQDRNPNELCMAGFVLKNTLSENGAVTRGICKVDAQGMLEKIVETKGIEKTEHGAVQRWEGIEKEIDADSAVSMNMWGMQPGFLEILDKGFYKFLSKVQQKEVKTEYLLPTIIGNLLEEDKVSVKVLKSKDCWFGVTYQEDKEKVMKELQALTDSGAYPNGLPWNSVS